MNYTGRRTFKDLELDLGDGSQKPSTIAPAIEDAFDTSDATLDTSTASSDAEPPVRQKPANAKNEASRVEADNEKHGVFRIGAPAPVAPAAAGEAKFMTEEQYLGALKDSDNSLPLLIISVAGALLCLYYGYTGFAGGGPFGAAFTVAGGAIALLLSIGLSFVVAKIVGALFGEDFGNFLELFTKVTAFAMAYDLFMVGVGMIMGPLFGLLFGLPAVLVLAIWLIGMDFFQAMVFAMASVAIKFMLMMVLAGAILGAVASSM